MKKILIAVILVVLVVVGYFFYAQIRNKQTPMITCDQSPFKGIVAYPPAQGPQTEKDRQYTLQASNGRIYYLRLTTSDQATALQAKLGKEAQASGSLVKSDSSDVNVATICP